VSSISLYVLGHPSPQNALDLRQLFVPRSPCVRCDSGLPRWGALRHNSRKWLNGVSGCALHRPSAGCGISNPSTNSGPTPAPYAYRGLPALAPLSMAGSVRYSYCGWNLACRSHFSARLGYHAHHRLLWFSGAIFCTDTTSEGALGRTLDARPQAQPQTFWHRSTLVGSLWHFPRGRLFTGQSPTAK